MTDPIPIVDRVLLEIKVKKQAIHAIHVCDIVSAVLKKYKLDYILKRGYAVMDMAGNQGCFTYFWLENNDGDRLDPLKIPGNYHKYYLSRDIPDGVECIDNLEQSIMKENNELWDKRNDKWFFTSAGLNMKNAILKKHPNNRFVDNGH